MVAFHRPPRRWWTRAFATLIAICLVSLSPCAARSAGPPNLWYAGKWLIFARAQPRADDLAVSTSDSTLANFLESAGATLAYQPGQKYIVVTAADGRTIDFTLGDPRFTEGGIELVAPFAPFANGGDAYVPFFALAKALWIDPVADGDATVLEPQIASLGIRSQGDATIVDLRGATKLRYEQPTETNDGRFVLVFHGVGSTLETKRNLSAEGVLQSVVIGERGYRA